VLPRFGVRERDVLIARVVIRAYNHRVRLLSSGLVVNNRRLLGAEASVFGPAPLLGVRLHPYSLIPRPYLAFPVNP
jgi:hypothetical protein